MKLKLVSELIQIASLRFITALEGSKITPKFFLSSLLQIPIVIGKSVNFLLTKFTPG